MNLRFEDGDEVTAVEELGKRFIELLEACDVLDDELCSAEGGSGNETFMPALRTTLALARSMRAEGVARGLLYEGKDTAFDEPKLVIGEIFDNIEPMLRRRARAEPAPSVVREETAASTSETAAAKEVRLRTARTK